MKKLSLAFALIAAHSLVQAEDWQPRFDLLTAGAAASVMLHHLCAGPASSKRAAEEAAVKLQREALETGQVHTAVQYAQESYRLKLRAFEMSTSGQRCGPDLTRLVRLAESQGFSVPR